MLQFKTLMSVVFKPHRLKLDDFIRLRAAGMQDPTENILQISVPVYAWDDFMDGTLSRQLVCTGIFFVRFDFLVLLSSAALGASHQHSKMVRKSYSAYKLIELATDI